MQQRCLIVGVGGASGSGKSSLCQALRERLGRGTGGILEMDRYYRDLSHLTPGDRDARDFDAPDAIDFGLLMEQVARLAQGEPVRCPNYDFASHTRVEPGTRMEPVPVLLVEGIFCLVPDGLRRMLAWSVFVATPDELCLARRLARDVGARGRTEEEVRTRYATHVRPAAERIVIPSARHARRIVSGARPLAELCDEVLEDLRRLPVPGAEPGARAECTAPFPDRHPGSGRALACGVRREGERTW